MCFRPATASVSVNCPECGKKINEVMGTIPNVCPFCEADLKETIASKRLELQTAPVQPPISLPSPPHPPVAAPKAPKPPSAKED